MLYATHAQLLSSIEHQLIGTDGIGRIRCYASFPAPPHRTTPMHRAQPPASLEELVSSRLLHAKDEVTRRFANGAAIVQRFELAAQFEEELKARLLESTAGACVILTALAQARDDGAPDDMVDETSERDDLGMFLDAMQERADARELALLALVSDEGTCSALVRRGFEIVDAQMLPGTDCPLQWTTLARRSRKEGAQEVDAPATEGAEVSE
jgi:hypothetical protein